MPLFSMPTGRFREHALQLNAEPLMSSPSFCAEAPNRLFLLTQAPAILAIRSILNSYAP